MNNLILITQGSQAISLIRTLFSLKYEPKQLTVFTEQTIKNRCFIKFLDYYKIKYYFNIDMDRINSEDIVISYSNSNKIEVGDMATFINFHPGILPKYKGSLSSVHSLINGETEVGGTWHYMTNKIDCGNILYQFKIIIDDLDTAFSLNHKIFDKATECLGKVLEMVKSKETGTQQTSEGKFYYNKFPMIEKLDNKLQKRITYFPPEYTDEF